MSDGIMITIGDDGEATLYDDTYDITIHCESKEEQDEVRKALENIPHWIPVTERLPEKEGRYLVTNSKIGAWHVDVDFYRPYMGGWMYDQGVTAWMPLPEPYKGVTT